jgi:hypothetical protein
MDLDSLVEEIERKRITLDEVPLAEVRPHNLKDPLDVKGRIAETMVRIWISRCKGIIIDDDFPRAANGYRLEKNHSGIIVYRGNLTVHEYDFLAFYQDLPLIVEVKSLKLNGVEAKIPRALKIGKEIYQAEEIGMLLFFPAYTNKQRDKRRIEQNFPSVRCVDLGYKKKQIDRAVGRFY